MSTDVLPLLFHKKWTKDLASLKNLNKYSEHDNYNLIQKYGEYLDTGHGKRYLEDKIHRSNQIFYKEGTFAKREDNPTSATSINRNIESAPQQYTNQHHRYHKKHKIKISSIKDIEKKNDIDFFLKQKRANMPINSLNLDSEAFLPNSSNNSNKISASIKDEQFRKNVLHPWRYSFKTVDYQTCTEAFRRVKSCCIDLSKY